MPTAIVPPVRDPQAAPAASFRRTFWAYVSGVILLLLFGALLLIVIGRAAPDFEDVDRQRAKERYKIYDGVIQSDQKALNEPANWLNKEKGTIRLPLAQAINLTLEELKGSQPRAAYPVAQTSPAPNPAPPVDPKAAAGQPPTTTNANNPVLTKQPDAAASTGSNAGPSPTPGKPEGENQPR